MDTGNDPFSSESVRKYWQTFGSLTNLQTNLGVRKQLLTNNLCGNLPGFSTTQFPYLTGSRSTSCSSLPHSKASDPLTNFNFRPVSWNQSHDASEETRSASARLC